MDDRIDQIMERFAAHFQGELDCTIIIYTEPEWQATQRHPSELFGWTWPVWDDEAETMTVGFCPEVVAALVITLDDYDADTYLTIIEYVIDRHIQHIDMPLDERIAMCDELIWSDTKPEALSFYTAMQMEFLGGVS